MTAVEWLVNEITAIDWQDPYWKIKLEKAKELHRDEIEMAYEIGYINGGNAKKVNSEQYYNETYKSE